MQIFIADTNQDLRVGLQFLLHQEPGFHVIGVADNGKDLPTRIKTSQPDVLLLDWHLPGVPVTELVADIKGLEMLLKIIVISVRPEDKSVAMAAGANDFAVKNAPPDKLLAILRDYSQTPADGAQFARKKKQT